MNNRYFGQAIKRTEDVPLIKGDGRFVDDIKLPGLLEAAFVRSRHSHALIGGVDTGAAKAMPGVVAVLTFRDILPYLTQERLPIQFRSSVLPPDCTQTPLAKDEVSYVGEAIAIVVASTRYAAEDAANAVEVNYEPLPAISDCREGAQPKAPLARTINKTNVLTRINRAMAT